MVPFDARHRGLAVFACVFVPLATYVFAPPAIGYTMYAGIERYQLTIESTKGTETKFVDPDAIAPVMGGSAPIFLLGAGHVTSARSVTVLRAHLFEVGLAACDVSRGDRIRVILNEFPDDGPSSSTEAVVECR